MPGHCPVMPRLAQHYPLPSPPTPSGHTQVTLQHSPPPIPPSLVTRFMWRHRLQLFLLLVCHYLLVYGVWCSRLVRAGTFVPRVLKNGTVRPSVCPFATLWFPCNNFPKYDLILTRFCRQMRLTTQAKLEAQHVTSIFTH